MKHSTLNFNVLCELTQLLLILAPVVITGQSHPGQDASQTHIAPPQQQAFQQSSYSPMAPQNTPYPPASSPYSANATTVPMATTYPPATYPTSPYPVSAAPYPTSQPIGGMPMPELPAQAAPYPTGGAPYPPVNQACPYPPAANFANPPTYNEAVTNDYPKQMPYNPAYNPDFKG